MKTYVAIDFDECLVDTHLSMAYGQAFETRNNVASPDDYGHSSDSLSTLLKRYSGYSRQSLAALADEIVLSTQWRIGAKDFLQALVNDPDMDVEIISSGLDIPIHAFLARSGLSIKVHTCALDFNDDICTGGTRTISSDDKRRIVEEAINIYGVGNVFAIGHGEGDLAMMSVTPSLCIPKGYKPCEDIAEYCAKDFTGALEWLKTARRDQV